MSEEKERKTIGETSWLFYYEDAVKRGKTIDVFLKELPKPVLADLVTECFSELYDLRAFKKEVESKAVELGERVTKLKEENEEVELKNLLDELPSHGRYPMKMVGSVPITDKPRPKVEYPGLNKDYPNEEMFNKYGMKYKKKALVVSACHLGEEFEIDTLEGKMKGNPGDYLVKGIKGEFYPVKKEIFEASYDLIEEELK